MRTDEERRERGYFAHGVSSDCIEDRWRQRPALPLQQRRLYVSCLATAESHYTLYVYAQ